MREVHQSRAFQAAHQFKLAMAANCVAACLHSRAPGVSQLLPSMPQPSADYTSVASTQYNWQRWSLLSAALVCNWPDKQLTVCRGTRIRVQSCGGQCDAELQSVNELPGVSATLERLMSSASVAGASSVAVSDRFCSMWLNAMPAHTLNAMM